MTDRPLDPDVGWYEYRGARFQVKRLAGFFDRYYVGAIELPWLRGSLVALRNDAGWFGWSARAVIRKVQRSINREFRRCEANGERTDTRAYADSLPPDLPPLPEPERDYRVLA